MLQIDKLTVRSIDDGKEILKDFDLTINDGEIHALMGPNGIGKSTICKCLLSDPNYEKSVGKIIYNDVDITNKSTTEISRLGMGMISQSPIAIEGVTNAEMLRMALSEKTGKHIDIFAFQKKVKEICNKISLPEAFIHRDINSGASGGERKKIELLHVWILTPSFLILDEIDSGLDVDALKIVANSIKEYHKEYNCSILLITHNPKLLNTLKPDFVHVIKNKKIVKTGDLSLATQIEAEGYNNIN